MRTHPLTLALLIALALIAAAANAQDDSARTAQSLIEEGIALHDQQRYDEAIAMYERALDAEPDNAFAYYEIALTHQATNDFTSCVDAAAEGLERGEASGAHDYYISGLYGLLGSCHSAAGDTDRALAVFREGLERFPDNYSLQLNIGITLANTERLPEARQHFTAALRLDPKHPSPYYLLAGVLRREGYRPASMLAYIAFLQKEFNTERSSRAAVQLINLMHAPKAGDEAPVVTVSVEEDLTRGFTGLDMAYYSAKIERTEDDEVAEPLGENLANAISIYVRMAAIVSFDEGEGGIVAERLLPRTVDIVEADVVEPFAWFVLTNARVPGAAEWMRANTDNVDRLVEMMTMANRGDR